MDFIVTGVETLTRKLSIDRSRVAVGGLKTGSAMARLFGFRHRDLFDFLVLIDSVMSRGVGSVVRSPVEPMMVLMAATTSTHEKQKSTVERVNKAHLPFRIQRKSSEKFSDWIEDVLDWVNTSDRFLEQIKVDVFDCHPQGSTPILKSRQPIRRWSRW